MATAVLSNVITDPAGDPVVGVTVNIRLWPGAGFRESDNSEISQLLTVVSNGSGAWSATLQRTDDIVPSGSYWQVEEQIPESAGGPKQWLCELTGNATVPAARVNPTLATGLATFLTQAQGDARYIQQIIGTALVGRGTFAARPASGSAGEAYIAEDIERWYAWSGAESRWVAPDESSGINPLDYGAKCDGIANDTAGLQEAIDATPSGGTLLVPGICKFDHVTSHDKPFDIVGYGCHLPIAADNPFGSSNWAVANYGGSVLLCTATTGIGLDFTSSGGLLNRSPNLRHVGLVGPGVGTAQLIKLSGGMVQLGWRDVVLANGYDLALFDFVEDWEMSGLVIAAYGNSGLVAQNFSNDGELRRYTIQGGAGLGVVIDESDTVSLRRGVVQGNHGIPVTFRNASSNFDCDRTYFENLDADYSIEVDASSAGHIGRNHYGYADGGDKVHVTGASGGNEIHDGGVKIESAASQTKLIGKFAGVGADGSLIDNSSQTTSWENPYEGPAVGVSRLAGVATPGSTLAVTANAHLGTGRSASISGNALSGRITLVTGTGAAGGVLASISFGTSPFPTAVRVQLTAANQAAATLTKDWYTVNQTASGFDIALNATPTDSASYLIDYFITS